MQFSRAFNLRKSQGQLDFVDVSTAFDTPVFLDPYAIEIKQNDLAQSCADCIRSYFGEVLDSLRTGDHARAQQLTAHLSEPRDTYIGVSKGVPSGRGVGREQADDILAAMARSRAFTTGILADLSEAELMVEGVGRDKVSDLTTNVIRRHLIEYTQAQCDLHSIELDEQYPTGPMWDPIALRWVDDYAHRPLVNGEPVLLIPKSFVRRNLSLNSQEFYNHHILNFLRAEHLSANSSLVQVFKKTKQRYVTKKSLKAIQKSDKNSIADFITRHPDVLERYKKIKGASGALRNQDIDPTFREDQFAAELIKQLQAIPPGVRSASEYHSCMTGILTFLFYPSLINPIKEKEIHKGKKRIDIKFTNAAEGGFFQSLMNLPQTRALSIIVECKNYSSDIANPELDQISGRFSPVRGKFGIITCRALKDRPRMDQRCLDTAKEDRGYVVVLEDAHVIEMLQRVATGRKRFVEQVLRDEFEKLAD